MTETFLALNQPAAAGGVEQVRFFNGRLLSGGDLTREQAASRAREALTGMAIGTGVVSGFDVAQSLSDKAEAGAVVTVSAGLAIAPDGTILHLPGDQRLQLTRAGTPLRTNGDSCEFGVCTASDGGSYVAGEGLYVLVASRSVRTAGRAQVNGIPGDAASCNVDREIAAVAFRLLRVRPHLLGGMSQAAPAFRNTVAFACFGSGMLASWPVNLLARDRRDDDLLTQMREFGLAQNDVPLALVAFTGALDLRFIDGWAVRRPCELADAASIGGAAIASMTSPRRIAIGRAMLAQFQDHLAALRTNAAGFPAVRARTHFPQLPPAGLLPGMDAAAAKTLFGGMTVRGPVHLNAAQVEPLLRESLSVPAIRSASNEVVWLYAVAENLIAGVKATAAADRPDPYLLFASGNLPYRADARFNLHRWNYANFALGG
ncbi:MAG: hypothetical protein ABIT04_09820 [Novosphingobium sp.]